MSDEEVMIEEAPEEIQPEHIGFGRYRVPGYETIFDSEAEAVAFLDRQAGIAEVENRFGDVEVPNLKVKDRTLLYRGSVMELPMNEKYLPNGDFNPYYDRQWLWAWGRLDGASISTKRAKGYKPVTEQELKKGIKDNKIPEHYESLLYSDGTYLLYGDAVLMRMPRTLWRQHQAEREAAAMQLIYNVEEETLANADRLGMDPIIPQNQEVRSGLKVHGF